MSAPTLADFFAQMHPFLLGRDDLAAAQQRLGPSPSGPDNFAFYRTLVVRNVFKILRGLYPAVRELALRRDQGEWKRLVEAYTAAHPPADRDPNAFGEAFADFLAEQRQRHGTIPSLWEELADYAWIRHRANVCPDDVGDGFEQRLFVRQYTHDVAAVTDAIARDPAADLPGARTVVLIVYRHARGLDVRRWEPHAPALAALAVRQGLPLPEPFRALDPAAVAAAEVFLVEHGVLFPQETPAS